MPQRAVELSVLLGGASNLCGGVALAMATRQELKALQDTAIGGD